MIVCQRAVSKDTTDRTSTSNPVNNQSERSGNNLQMGFRNSAVSTVTDGASVYTQSDTYAEVRDSTGTNTESGYMRPV